MLELSLKLLPDCNVVREEDKTQSDFKKKYGENKAQRRSMAGVYKIENWQNRKKCNIEEYYGGEQETGKETFMVEVVGIPQYGLRELCCGERQDGVRMKGGRMGWKLGWDGVGENKELPFASLTSLHRNKAWWEVLDTTLFQAMYLYVCACVCVGLVSQEVL